MTSRAIVVSAGLIVTSAAAASADFLEWKGHGLEVRATGYFQGDLRAFPGWDVAEGQRDDWADVRRLRAGFEWKSGPLSGELVVDAGDLVNRAGGDGDHRPAFTPRKHLKNAYLELALGKKHYLRAGNVKIPVTREFTTSAAKTDFIERSRMADSLAPDRDLGVMAGGKWALVQGLTYQLGVFAGDGWSKQSRAETTVAGRVELEIVKNLELAVSGSAGTVEANPETGTSSAPPTKGLHGQSAASWTFYHRSYVDGARRRLGADVRYTSGPWTFTSEVLQARDERKGQSPGFQDLPAVAGFGWFAGAKLRLSGPRSKKDKARAGQHPLDLALRVESLAFDDQGPGDEFPSLASRAANLRPLSIHGLVGGVSTEPRPYLRLMGNVILERYNDGLAAPEPGRQGTYVTLLARLQLQIP
jgi:hypothetical protein